MDYGSMESLLNKSYYLYEEPEIAATTNVTNTADADYDTVSFTGTSGTIVLYGATDVAVVVTPSPLKNVKGSSTPENFIITVTNNTNAPIPAAGLSISDDFSAYFTVVATPNKPRYRYYTGGTYSGYTDAGWTTGNTVTLSGLNAIAVGDFVELEVNTTVNA